MAGDRVAYVMQEFPMLTTTFVYREIEQARRLGFEPQLFSIWRPAADETPKDPLGLQASTHYALPVGPMRVLIENLRCLIGKPARYLGAIRYLMARRYPRFRQRWRTLLHFGEAVLFSSEMDRAGVRHVHAHSALNAASVALALARLNRTSFSFTVRANDLFVDPLLLSEKLRSAAFIVSISDYNRAVLEEIEPSLCGSGKVHVIHSAIPLERFKPASVVPGREVPQLLSIGRLVEKKGFRHLIEACRMLHERDLRIRLEIIGDGPLRDTLTRQIAAANLEEWVQLRGPLAQEQVIRSLAATDLFALPCVVARDGDRDGIPNVLMEAMACQRPVIATPVSGVPELVIHGETGWLVAPEDPRALADGIEKMLSEPALCAKLAAAGRAKVEADFNIERTVERLVGLFRQQNGGSRG